VTLTTALFRDDLSSAGWYLLPLTYKLNLVSNYTHCKKDK